MSVLHDLLELGQHLRQERLFVGTEREQLQRLYEEVRKVGEDLFHASWISRQQKLNLDHLQAMGHEVPSEEICAKNNQLETVYFHDSYKVLGHHDSKYGDLFKYLRENPVLLANCVCTQEKTNITVTVKVVGIIMSAVYGNCVLQEDEHFALQLLKTLIDVQLGSHDNPRRVVRRGNCAFSLVFKQLSDMLFSTRLFLTAALHDPVMRLLMEDEWFYDIDPEKALVRFPPKERLKRFGEPGTEDYKTKVQNYRKFIVDKLVLLCTRFINSIKSNIHCFPASISWIVSQVYQTLTKGNKISTAEVRATCADLIFALFICPAICDPEPYGITSDVPISHIACHNLMQMAQIVQVLTISQWDEIDPKVRDLYGRFEKGCMSSFLDSLVEGIGEEPPASGNNSFQTAARSTILLTQSQLQTLVNCLKNACSTFDDKVTGRKQLEELLTCLPSDTPQGQGHENLLSAVSAQTPGMTPPGTPSSQKKLFRGMKKKNSQHNLHAGIEEQNKEGETTEGDSKTGEPIDDVLVISLGVGTDCPGMMAENKILSWEQENRRRKVKYSTDISEGGPIEIHEKRTRFSLSHDQESIGNTSDYQEAISEAASSHSVDMENDNDNLSDMMSADVSGRGSPSISGRDTPLSQAGSVEERAPAEFAVPVPETVQKQNRVDVTERFGKFEIKTELERDETKSTVSDTWSTDVLASDSEPPEQNQLERLEEVAEEMSRPPPFLLAPRDADGDNAYPPSLSEMSETASDAWSTDVLASDTDDKQSELLTDLDQDDVSMSSVMERSDNQDDSLEETPLASGGHSPERDLMKFGVVGGATVKRSDSLGSEEDVFADDVTPSAETSQLSQAVESAAAAAAEKQEKSEGRGEDQSQGQNRIPSESLRHAQGRVSAVVSHIEPENRLASAAPVKSDNLSLPKDFHCGARPKEFHKKGHHHHHGRSHGGYNSAKVEAWAKSNGIGGNKDGPKFGAEFEIISMARSAGSKQVPQQKTPTGTNNDQDGDGGIEMSLDVNGLADQVESVGLSEQQNTRFNENRLSAALSLFDPLSPENNSTGDLLEGSGSSEPHGGTLPAAACPSRMSAPPSFSGAQIFIGAVPPAAQRATSEILISVSSSEEVQGQIQSSAETVKSSSQEEMRPRRDSSDSSHSTASLRLNNGATPSKDSSADVSRSNGDNISMRSDEKDFSENEERGYDKNNKKSFFKSVKEKIHKGIKRRTVKADKDFNDDAGKAGAEGEGDPKAESSFDILDKYRKKAPQDQQAEDQSELTDSAYQSQTKDDKLLSKDEEDGPPFYDPANLETCFAFQDAKRKLRIVLSAGDFLGTTSLYQLMTGQPNSPREFDTSPKKDNDLICLLRAQLAEAINLQNKDVIAQLHEVIRCIRLFDNDGCKKLVKALREEYRSRSAYVSYLIRCRQGLLMSHSFLQRLLNRIQRDKEICNKHMVNVCVRLFIEKREKHVLFFIADFQKLTLADEKTDLVDKFLQILYKEMEQDCIWKAATESQILDARLAVERLLMSRVYSHAMFPNGDGDFMRDQLFHQHIKTLSGIITPIHKDLGIPRVYHFECPWPAAQREIYMINAYKTPKDKLQCVLRCSTTIMNLLSMANEKSVPAADDFMPVLIYVLIKANPPCLLSTIQYVNSFYESRLAGEEQYWWMQFASAVEFIKTMEYSV